MTAKRSPLSAQKTYLSFHLGANWARKRTVANLRRVLKTAEALPIGSSGKVEASALVRDLIRWHLDSVKRFKAKPGGL